MEAQDFLQELGRQLRAAREHADLSLAELAPLAGLSRRYVTEAEAGRANLSIGKLRGLSRALGVGLSDLLAFDQPRLSERVALVGLRGAGKSTLGRRVALALEAPFVELDKRVEELAGMELAEIFDLHGQDYFHTLEAEALESVLAEGSRLVLAAGGSIVRSPENFERLLSSCRTIWLRATPEEHFGRVQDQGDRRPMRNHPRAMEELRGLLEARRGQYARCEMQLSTSGKSLDEVEAELCKLIEAGS